MGVVIRIGRDMSYRIIPISGQPIAETTVKNVNCDDMLDPYIAVQIKTFEKSLTERLDDNNFITMTLMIFELETKEIICRNGTHGVQHTGTRIPPKLKHNTAR